MFSFLVIIHVIVSIILIAVILFQAGKGDMASTFGGSGTANNLFGTHAATFLSRATTVCATVFILTSLALAVTSSHSRSSIVEKAAVKAEKPKAEPAKASEASEASEPVKEEAKQAPAATAQNQTSAAAQEKPKDEAPK